MIPRKTMAETMAEQIREAILAGAWKPGSVIPTEPELAKQFGVSRAVVRDATRIIAAWGLVEARQGKGVFVTADQAAGFGTALLLALRRTGATVWDVEEFEQILFPEAAAMVASRLGEIDIDTLRRQLEVYEKSIVKQVRDYPGKNWFVGGTREAWFHFVDTFFEMTGNRLMARLGPAIVRIRNVRVFDGEPDVDPVAVSRREIRSVEKILAAVGTGIPKEARSVTAKLLNLPEEVETAMKKTPVGEAARIPMDLEDFLKESGN
jgi:GntR family transcriptional repressor for pyruvate dehydrogenase complex